ncbi:MAG: 50S ribosomal protein L18 [Thermincolia bacterium]
MITRVNRKEIYAKKHLRVRKNISGTAERPRLSVYRSLNHIYAQVINDVDGVTIAAASSLEPGLKDKLANGSNTEAAKAVGSLVAQKAKDKGVSKVVFDRGGNIYHGRVKALAEAAREGGLEF